MNPLNNYPGVRAILYMVQWIVTGIQTVLSALFAFQYGTPDDWPRWFLAGLAVLPVLWTYLGLTAQNNVSTEDPDEMLDEDDYEGEHVAGEVYNPTDEPPANPVQ